MARDLLCQWLNARNPVLDLCLSNEEKGKKKTSVALKTKQRLQLFKCIVVFHSMGIIDNDDRIFARIGTFDSLNLKCALQGWLCVRLDLNTQLPEHIPKKIYRRKTGSIHKRDFIPIR